MPTSAAIEKTLSENLKSLRSTHQYTQSYVSAELGICRSTYSFYEKGERALPSWILFKVAQLYGVSVDSLFKSRTTQITARKDYG